METILYYIYFRMNKKEILIGRKGDMEDYKLNNAAKCSFYDVSWRFVIENQQKSKIS